MESAPRRARGASSLAVRLAAALAVLAAAAPPSFSVPSQTRFVNGMRENPNGAHALVGARVVVRPGQVIDGAVVVVRNGAIEAVGPGVPVPADARVWDLSGRTIYAAFVDAACAAGMPAAPDRRVREEDEVPWEPAPLPDRLGAHHWNAQVHPESRASLDFHYDPKAVEALRGQGVGAAVATPQDGLFRGTSAVFLLEEGDANQIVLASDAAQVIELRGGIVPGQYPTSLMGAIAFTRQTFRDADWYAQAMDDFAKGKKRVRPETNLALDALARARKDKTPFVFVVNRELSVLRAKKIADEVGLAPLVVVGSGREYRRAAAIAAAGARVVCPVVYPAVPEVGSPEDALDVTLEDLRHWHEAPENAGRLVRAGVPIAFTSAGTDLEDDPKEEDDGFLDGVREAVRRGLAPDAALAALTLAPAEWFGVADRLGSVEKGKLANLVVTDGDVFDESTRVLETWVEGVRYEVDPDPVFEPRGSWRLSSVEGAGRRLQGLTVDVEGRKLAKLTGKASTGERGADLASVSIWQTKLSFVVAGDSLGLPGAWSLTGLGDVDRLSGTGVAPDGATFAWSGERSAAWERKPRERKGPDPASVVLPDVFPRGAYGRAAAPTQPDAVAVTHATLWTSGPAGTIEDATLLVRKGKIAAVGANVSVPAGAIVIDGRGKHVTAGIIDCHSHIAIDQGVNDHAHASSAEVRIGDVVNPDDVAIYRQLAGGTTASHLLHGSANPIGGQCQAIKLRWGALPEEMKLQGARPTIKFALGENVKQSNWGEKWKVRYPQTRMGVEQIYRDAFTAARDYEGAMDEAKKDPFRLTPRPDLQLDCMLEILRSERDVHCHSYRQDEILMLMRVAEDFGFHVACFQHILEGYKVADVMAAHGAGGSTFSDWWAYKFEVYDAIPYNGALMHDAGVVVSFNSDSAELGRRLNLEAAKAVKYGGVSQEEAWKFVTWNPAVQIGAQDKVGSLEVGKDADFVVWSGPPMSTYTHCEQTWVDGRRYFEEKEDAEMRDEVRRERALLLQLALASEQPKKPGGGGGIGSEDEGYSCSGEGE